MRRVGGLWAAGSLILLPSIPVPAEPLGLETGAYQVMVRLELPHLDNVTTEKTARLCLSAAPGSNNHGFAVLSDNNPLAGCPIKNVYEDAGQVAFDIVCDGRNAARAKAHYQVQPNRFTESIVMQMGGKNMTMTEMQSGRRVGACEDGRPPAL